MDIAAHKFDAFDFVERDTADKILRQPVLSNGTPAERSPVDHQGVPFENLGADVIVTLDTVPLPVPSALVAAGIADAVKAEFIVQHRIEPRHPLPILTDDFYAEALALRRNLQVLTIRAVEVTGQLIVPRLGGHRRIVTEVFPYPGKSLAPAFAGFEHRMKFALLVVEIEARQ